MELEIKNFRSIRELGIKLAPITLFYGANGAGKSSLLYSPVVFRNIALNSNQKPNAFFYLNFLNLGSYEAVVYDHKKANKIRFGLKLEKGDLSIKYAIEFGSEDGNYELVATQGSQQLFIIGISVAFPYAGAEKKKENFIYKDGSYQIVWNGITSQVTSVEMEGYNKGDDQTAVDLAAFFNSPIEQLRKVAIVPLKRGFSKPHHSPVAASQEITTEDELATVLSNNKYLVSKVSHYLEKVVNRDFRINSQPGTAIFSLDATDRSTGVASELVNEGFGVNQIVFLLARCLYQDSDIICIEEPEVHLHPSAVRLLAKTLALIARDESKRFLISTHSETFLVALLAEIASGEVPLEDVACYFTNKQNKETKFEQQKINKQGQIEGGLLNFIKEEMKDVGKLLGVSEG